MDDSEMPRRDLEGRSVELTREIERRLEAGTYRMINTRLLFERHVISPDHLPIAHSIPVLERMHGSQYVLADGRTIEQLTMSERASLVEFEIEQPTKVTADSTDEEGLAL